MNGAKCHYPATLHSNPMVLSIIVTGRIRELPYSYRVRSVTKKANAGEEKILSGGNAIY